MKRFALVFLLAFFVGCVTPQLDQAFDGDLDNDEADTIISEYCVSCHLHKDFEAETHVFNIKYGYDSESPYYNAQHCRDCHTYTKTWLLDVRRGTHRPSLKK